MWVNFERQLEVVRASCTGTGQSREHVQMLEDRILDHSCRAGHKQINTVLYAPAVAAVSPWFGPMQSTHAQLYSFSTTQRAMIYNAMFEYCRREDSEKKQTPLIPHSLSTT